MAFKLRKPPRLDAKLKAYPYQLDAVRAVGHLPYAAIFHEQGLGKTKIAVDLVLSWLDEDVVDTVFIITKKSLIKNWMEELSMHSYVRPRVLSDNRRQNSHALNAPVMLYVMNYEVISANLDLLQLFLKTCRVGVILDESQKIKNPGAKITRDFISLADNFHRKIIMTGTPVANRPHDIWSQIKFLDNGVSLGESYSDFKEKSDLPKHFSNSKEYGDYLSGILSKIRKFSVRETKRSSGLELPDKTIVTHRVEMAPQQASIYASYRDRLAYEFENEDVLIRDEAEGILKRLLRLVQCASNPFLVDDTYREVPGKFQKLIDFLATEVKMDKAIVWTGFIKNASWLAKKLPEYKPALVHGNLAIDVRNKAIDSFKKDPKCRVLVATPGAAKEGLTLTVANYAVFYDRSFSLDDYLQAQDRIHRISQTQECFVHNLIAKNTIDEWIDELLNAKHQAAKLVQGDIKKSEFKKEFDFDLSASLAQILSNN